MLSTTPAMNYGRFIAFVINVLILEPIVYCALFVKEDKTGTEESQVSSMYYDAWWLFTLYNARV